jgi:DNA-binding NtrC family response regulator
LRVLQEKEVLPVGTDRPVKVDLRVVTATLKNLDHEVAERRFREDLRARLLGVQIELLPLRERREDLGWLISMLLRRAHGERPVTFSAEAVSALYRYDWPLNVRELERAIAAAALAPTVQLQSLPRSIREAQPASPVAAPPEVLSPEDAAIKQALVAAIESNGGNLAAVARELGRDRKQIHRWIKRFGLTRK